MNTPKCPSTRLPIDLSTPETAPFKRGMRVVARVTCSCGREFEREVGDHGRSPSVFVPAHNSATTA